MQQILSRLRVFVTSLKSRMLRQARAIPSQPLFLSGDDFGKGERLPEPASFYDTLVSNSPIAIATLDTDSQVTSCNPAFETLFSYQQADVLGRKIDTLITTEANLQEAVDYTHRVLRLGETIRAVGQRSTSAGDLVDVEILALPVIDQGAVVGVLTLYQDISAHKRAEEARQEMVQSFTHIMDSIDADVYVADMATYEILFMNKHMRDSFGGDLVNRICWEVFRGGTEPCPHCTNKLLLDEAGKPTGDYIWEGSNPITGLWYKNSDRAIKWHDGRFVRLQIATDITKLKQAEKKLAHLATHDPLTKLPNRALLQDLLDNALQQAQREGTRVGLIFLDLDRFKEVNDRFGHPAGDLLLKDIARRLRGCLRASDTIARVSGDEFIVLTGNMTQATAAAVVAEKIIACLAQPFLLADTEVYVTASLGISVYPEDGREAESLIQRADQAMYFVKEHGKNNYRLAREVLGPVQAA
jgi:diguanylate cyclase (GGDEF)-like protein/PAS domain S-box-containing protein